MISFMLTKTIFSIFSIICAIFFIHCNIQISTKHWSSLPFTFLFLLNPILSRCFPLYQILLFCPPFFHFFTLVSQLMVSIKPFNSNFFIYFLFAFLLNGVSDCASKSVFLYLSINHLHFWSTPKNKVTAIIVLVQLVTVISFTNSIGYIWTESSYYIY